MSDILNVNKFIKENKLQEVTNPSMFVYNKKTGEPEPTDDGLFSFKIFGPLHSPERSKTWAYMSLGTEIVHPVIITMFEKTLPSLVNIALRKKKYVLDSKTGLPVADPDNGRWGVSYLKEIFDKIQWENVPNYENKKQYIEKLKSLPKDVVFINKWVIIPAGLRDFSVQRGRIVYDEINDKYQSILISVKSTNTTDTTLRYFLQVDDTTGIGKETLIQKQIVDLHNYFLSKLSSKSGLVRGALIKKRVDFVTRLVASALPDVPPHAAVLPWGALLNTFAPFIIHEIENDLQLKKMMFGDADYVSLDEYSNMFQYIFKNMSTIANTHKQLKNALIEKLKKVLNEHELMLALKRDPAFGHTSWHYVYPIINTEDVYNIIVNSIYYAPLGGDSIECLSVFLIKPGKKLKLNRGNMMWFKNPGAKIQPLSRTYKEKMKRARRDV